MIEAAAGDRLAEAQHQRLLGLRHGEQGAADGDDADKKRDGEREEKARSLICGLLGRARKAGSGTKGVTPPPPFDGSSRMTLSAPPSTRSIVSR